uniref:Uncharacterized protein n=1 Tax=Anopheles christyi TaxID=43041 RepID=A0A9I3A6L9_9DIPT
MSTETTTNGKFNLTSIIGLFPFQSTTNCISKQQMEPLVPEQVLRKCQEREAANHNPGTEQFEVCYQQCAFEELGAIEGFEVRVEKLYPLAEGFAADYRHAVHLAIDECSRRLRNIRDTFEQMKTQCSLLGFTVDRCVRLIIYENCPTGRWKASIACTKIRQGVPFC